MLATLDQEQPPTPPAFDARTEAAALTIPHDSRKPARSPTAWTPAQARAMARRSHVSRKAKAAAELAAAFTPPLAASPDQDPALQVIARELGRLDAALSAKLSPSERANLVGALDRLLERRRILLGTPLPGSERPGRAKDAPASRTTALLGTDNGAHSITPGRSDQE